ncbi:MAG TPA: CpXC domain-containing protein [Patescibacteria group bacterium]|nr:CpXC domain-containing protein [Patescibacteria group bacterium]
MQSQFTCPSCRNVFAEEVHQIVDVGLQPELKEMLLSGYLNVVQCPNCSAITRVEMPMLYHDPAHELFMVYMPIEMKLSHTEQQEQIGLLVKQAMDRLPAEQRRGYMFQPLTLISQQTLIEKVLATEGVTPEMLSRQTSQMDLLRELLSAEGQSAEVIISENDDLVDETFFAILRSLMESAENPDQETESLKLVNIQAKLYKLTTVGQRLERQQLALLGFNREAKREGLSQKLLLKHVLANREDGEVVRALVVSGQQAFDYQFFLLLSEKIEKREKAGVDVHEMVALREALIELQQRMERQSREALADANATLLDMIAAKDKTEAVQDNLDRLDDLFMMVLSANLAQAKEAGDTQRLESLQEIQESIFMEAERQAPPEIGLVNQLVRSESEEQRIQLLDKNQALIKPELLQLTKRIELQAQQEGNVELQNRLVKISSLIASRLLN